MKNYVLLSYPKMNEEYGEYAAEQVLKILGGTDVSTIPVTKNKRTNVTINSALMRALQVTFPSDLLELANLITPRRFKIAMVNSYHLGYEWSDGIESGLLKALSFTEPQGKEFYQNNDIELQIYRMNTKNITDTFVHQHVGREVYDQIVDLDPDIVLTSDDNAAKWLVVPFLEKSRYPVLFCGLNWDASVYGFPTDNVTGMVEVAPVKELIAFLQNTTEGTKIGYLGADTPSERKEFSHYKNVLGIQFEDGHLVKTPKEWKRTYLRLQKSCDMIILQSHAGITNWNDAEMHQFVLQHSEIPTGSTSRQARKFAMVSFARVSEEQGWWLGKQTLNYKSGLPFSQIEMTRNSGASKFVYPKLLKKVGIQLPASFMDSAFIATEEELQ